VTKNRAISPQSPFLAEDRRLDGVSTW